MRLKIFLFLTIFIMIKSNPLINSLKLKAISLALQKNDTNDYDTILDGMVELASYFTKQILNNTKDDDISNNCRRDLLQILMIQMKKEHCIILYKNLLMIHLKTQMIYQRIMIA